MNSKVPELYSWGPPKLKNDLRLLQNKNKIYQIKKNNKKTDLVHIDYRFPSHLDTEVDLILALVTVHKLAEAVLGNH